MSQWIYGYSQSQVTGYSDVGTYDPDDPTLNMTILQLRDEVDRFDKAWELAELDEYGPEPEDPGQCYNCGAYAKSYDGHTYVCPVCGDEWDVWLDPLEDY